MATRKSTSKTDNSNLTGGPQTIAGKTVVGQNARSHGLTAKSPMYSDDDLAEIDRMATELATTYKAVGPAEQHFLKMLAVQFHRQKVLDAYIQLLADRAATEARLKATTIEYPNPLATFLADQQPDEMAALSKMRRSAPDTKAGDWFPIAGDYAAQFLGRDLINNPIIAAITGFATGQGSIVDITQAIDDRIAEISALQQEHKAARDRMGEITAQIAVHDAMHNEAIDKIQHGINRQIKLAIGNLKELQSLRGGGVWTLG